MTATDYGSVPIAGGDTAAPLNLEKRLALIRRYLPPEATRLIDCGCGAGTYVKLLRRELGIDAVGIEYLPEKAVVAQADADTKPFVFRGDIQRTPFADGTFDAALLNEVLEHVPNDAAALAEIRRVLKPGGVLIVFSPNRWFPFETHGVYLKGTERMLPPHVPFVPYVPVVIGRRVFRYWARNYGQRELEALCERSGFRTVATDFIWQTFENISGKQPGLIRACAPALRRIAGTLERTPGLRRFGVSQVLVLERTDFDEL